MTENHDGFRQHERTDAVPVGDLRLLEIREIPEMLEVIKNAYPSMKLHIPSEWVDMERDLVESQESAEGAKYYGVRKGDVLVGTMGLHDFQMNYHGQIVPAGGVGLVAVDLLHKKRGIAKSLISGFLHHYQSKGVPITLLYAFRTDFYQKMGFGFGPQMHLYRIPPARFPKGEGMSHVRLLGPRDLGLVCQYEQERFESTHGHIASSEQEIEARLKRPGLRMVGYVADGKLQGYVSFVFKQAHAETGLVNDLVVRDLTYRSPAVLRELFTFLHNQFDQFQNIVVSTQDQDFYHLIPDGRNGTGNMLPPIYHETNTAGVGLMYRIIDTEALFRAMAEHSFAGETCRVKFTIRDTFLPNHVGALVDFRNGFPMVEPDDEDYDVEVCADVGPFSSMMMGIIPLTKLVQYGLATVSDEAYLERLTTMFRTKDVPYCLTAF